MVARTAAQLLLLKPAVWRMVKVHVHGTEHLDTLEGAFVAVANHSSHLDTPLIFGSMPHRLSQNMATGAAADYFFEKWYTALFPSLFFNAFPVDRAGRGKKDADGNLQHVHRGLAGSLLSDGIPLLIFPEGTRSRTGAMGPFRPGSAALCISRNVPAVPIAIVGAFIAWPSNLTSPLRGRPPVHVVYGRPMLPMPGEIAHVFSERIRRQVIELHDTTANAYGMPTLAEYARTLAIEKARREELQPPRDSGAPNAGPSAPPEPPAFSTDEPTEGHHQ